MFQSCDCGWNALRILIMVNQNCFSGEIGCSQFVSSFTFLPVKLSMLMRFSGILHTEIYQLYHVVMVETGIVCLGASSLPPHLCYFLFLVF